MKLVIAGGRDFTNAEAMIEEINKLEGTLLPVNGHGLELICGMARGADITAYHIFKAAGYPVHEYVPDWDRLGKAAGYIRNGEMADAADTAVIFWDGQSRGTRNMIEQMQRRNKPYHVIYYKS